MFHENVAEYARIHKLTMEEAGRDVRRMRFEEVSASLGGAKIALAHHQDDNAETLLLNLCRGSRLRGLGGIAPVEGAYIRPLLGIRKREIESYLEKRGISYCTDETNLEENYTRNRIRNRVIPYLEKEVNRQTVRHMADMMEEIRGVAGYVQEETLQWLERCVKKTDPKGILIRQEIYMQIPEFLRSYVLCEALYLAAGHRKDVEGVHIRALQELMGKQTGRRISLPYGLEGLRDYEGILLKKSGQKEEESCPRVYQRIFDRPEGPLRFPDLPYTKWFDYDIIKNTVKIRHRQPGDYLTIDRQGNTQKLKQYFINEKIPREERDRIWLAADGQEIMWVAGFRQNQKYQISDRTKRILEIEFYGGEEND